MAEDANKKQNELQNLLQGDHALLEELKLEYEEHSEMMRLEWEMDKKYQGDQYKKLKGEFENFKLMQFEDKQQMLREQEEVVKALQTQFDEYRATAEYLFATEAAKLEDKPVSESVRKAFLCSALFARIGVHDSWTLYSLRLAIRCFPKL